MISDFGKWLKIKLYDKGMTQNEFAEQIGVTRTTITYYISGRMKPNGKRMLQIKEVLGEKPELQEKPRSNDESRLREFVNAYTALSDQGKCFIEVMAEMAIRVDGFPDVVRCKDCKHSKFDDGSGLYECRHPLGLCGMAHRANWFCADGERATD